MKHKALLVSVIAILAIFMLSACGSSPMTPVMDVTPVVDAGDLPESVEPAALPQATTTPAVTYGSTNSSFAPGIAVSNWSDAPADDQCVLLTPPAVDRLGDDFSAVYTGKVNGTYTCVMFDLFGRLVAAHNDGNGSWGSVHTYAGESEVWSDNSFITGLAAATDPNSSRAKVYFPDGLRVFDEFTLAVTNSNDRTAKYGIGNALVDLGFDKGQYCLNENNTGPTQWNRPDMSGVFRIPAAGSNFATFDVTIMPATYTQPLLEIIAINLDVSSVSLPEGVKMVSYDLTSGKLVLEMTEEVLSIDFEARGMPNGKFAGISGEICRPTNPSLP